MLQRIINWFSLGTNKTTLIHDKYYDLNNFRHPGGPIAISLAYERDATVLFELHHPFVPREQLEELMKKYEVSQPSSKTIIFADESYDHQGEREDPFKKVLIQRVSKYFKERGHDDKITWRRFVFIEFLFILQLFSFYYYIKGHYWSIIALPVMSWLYGVNSFHDATHFAISKNWIINMLFSYQAPYFSSPTTWYYQHIIGHHAYPNIGYKDPDLAHAPVFMRVHQSIKYKPNHQYQTTYFPLIWMVGINLGMSLMTDIRAYMIGTYNRVVKVIKRDRPRMMGHYFMRIIIFLLPFMIAYGQLIYKNTSIPKAIIFAVVPPLLYSFIFMTFTQINHLTYNAVTSEDKFLYRHQVKTANNIASQSQLVHFLTGGLNLQIEHHLFPAMNHQHLKAIQPIVKETCREFGIPYQEYDSIWEALKEHYMLMCKMSKKDE